MVKDLFSIYENFRKEHMKHSHLDAISKELEPFDLVDILSKIGGLSLLPENGSHATRLEALAVAAITNPYVPNRPKILKSKFQWILNKYLGVSSPITKLEDPCENLFTESFTSFDGSHIMFPGTFPYAGFVLRNINRSVFLANHADEKKQFRTFTALEMMFLATMSDEIAKRSNLKRGIFPSTLTWGENIIIPKSSLLRDLQSSVVISEKEIKYLFDSKNIPASVIEPYLFIAGTEKLPRNGFDSSGVYEKPIIKLEDKYIFIMPALLVPAIIHRILSQVVLLDTTKEFVETYRISVWDNAEFSLKILEAYAAMRPIVLENKNNNKIIECCYQIDSDKFLYVQFFVDGLTDYHEGEPFSEWKDNEIPKFIIDQQKLVLNRIRKDIPQIKDVTWLILVQGYGRPFHFNLNTSLIQCLTIALSVSELEVIAYSERGDRLALWKYLKHKEQQKQYRPILSMSELDEFELYRSHKHSYPLPDDIKGGIRVKPGIGGDLVRKVYSELDLHALAGYKPNSIIEVISSRNKKFAASVPSQFTHTIDRAAIVIEQFELPVWVTGPKYTKQSEVELHPLYGILVDAIGYWLFRSKDFTTKLLSGLKDKMDSLWIEISLQPSRTWRHVPVDLQEPDSNQNIHEYISVKIHEEGNKIKLIFKESIKAWLVGSDNRIERELMYLVFQAIRDFKKDKVGDFAQLQSNEEIREAINLYIPNGIRTMILIMPLLDPRYDNRSLPEVRLAQESDEVDVSKAIRTYLISKSLNNCHPNTKDEKIKFIHDIVDHLYTEFTTNVSLLAPSGVLEFLLAQHEAVVQNNFIGRLQIPPKLASFYSTPELIKELETDTPDNTRTSVALRFVVEYVTACSPKGLKTMSYETYDRLIALASEIIVLGTISDLIFYNIDEIDLEVKFGFLNIHQKSFLNAFERFTPNYFDQVIGRSVERFNLPWQRSQNARSEEKQNNLDKLFNEGFVAEFGYSYAEYMKLCVQMVIIGEKQNSPAKYLPLKRLLKLISEETKIPTDKVLHIIESLSLKERNNFLIHPPGYEKWEVYPWKINRRLSFLRKPLIKLTRPEEGILWGSRHLFNSVEFIHDLSCSGQLSATSYQMRNFKSIIRNQDGEAFNNEVYDVFNRHSELIVRKRLEKIQGNKMRDNRGELGDIDVFALNKTKKDILIIECKNLNAAISPIEYDSELRALFVDGDKDCAATKLKRRLKWIEENAELVAEEIRSPSFRGCSYHPLIVTSDELFTPYLNSTSVPTLSIKRLVSEYLPQWIQN